MNRGKTSVYVNDYMEEVEEYLDEREIEREDLSLLVGFRKFAGVNYEELLHIDE
jgi:hypothetical protein